MSRQKGTPNKKTIATVKYKTESGTHEETITTDDIIKLTDEEMDAISANLDLQETWPRYMLAEGLGQESFEQVVNTLFQFGYHCVGGVAIHDIRNPLTNEYEPHYYQAMEKLEK